MSSDIYSFGIVIIYVMLDHMVFLVNKEQRSGEDAWWYILRRHISYLGDEDGFKGLLRHIGEENPFFDRLIALANDFTANQPRTPFSLCPDVDEDLRDLIGKMTSLDPKRRITARQALGHPWFRQADKSNKK